MVWIDNHCEVRIGSNVCFSRNVDVDAGNSPYSI